MKASEGAQKERSKKYEVEKSYGIFPGGFYDRRSGSKRSTGGTGRAGTGR